MYIEATFKLFLVCFLLTLYLSFENTIYKTPSKLIIVFNLLECMNVVVVAFASTIKAKHYRN